MWEVMRIWETYLWPDTLVVSSHFLIPEDPFATIQLALKSHTTALGQAHSPLQKAGGEAQATPGPRLGSASGPFPFPLDRRRQQSSRGSLASCNLNFFQQERKQRPRSYLKCPEPGEGSSDTVAIFASQTRTSPLITELGGD